MRHPHRDTVTVLLLIVALLLAASGCAALKPFAAILIDAGIDQAEKLAAGGKAAIESAKKKAEAIPDAIERQTAMLEVMRAEQIYQTDLLEALASALLQPKEWASPSPTAEKSPVLARAE